MTDVGATVVVTGAAGFIGRATCDVLRRDGYDVRGVDIMLAQAHGDGASECVGVHRVDVRDTAAMCDVLAGADAVVHLAAMVGVGVDSTDAPEFASLNDVGTASLLSAMYQTSVGHLVLASSMVVYGEGNYPELVTEDAPIAPKTFYAASKAAQENYVSAWCTATGSSAVALRYHNVYGPMMPAHSPYSGVAAIFRSQLEIGRAPTVFEDGKQMRDFVAVADVAQANRLALDHRVRGLHAFNVCSGVPISIGEVAAILSDAADGPAPDITGIHRPEDVRHIVADPAKAQAKLGFTAAVHPRDGLVEFASAPLRD